MLNLGGVKGLQRGCELSTSNDLMIERTFSTLFFVKLQNRFPRNSCIPFKTIKTMQIDCQPIFSACFYSVVGSTVSRHLQISIPPVQGEAIKRAPQYFFVLDSKIFVKK